MILPIVSSYWGHQLRKESYLDWVICTGRDLKFARGFEKLRTVCSSNCVTRRGLDSSQDQEDAKRRDHYEERKRVHCYRQIASAEYMLFCNWLSRTGHSGLCASFCLHLDSERVAGKYPHCSPVDHLKPDGSMDSSVF